MSGIMYIHPLLITIYFCFKDTTDILHNKEGEIGALLFRTKCNNCDLITQELKGRIQDLKEQINMHKEYPYSKVTYISIHI